jgi:hypothetical protein
MQSIRLSRTPDPSLRWELGRGSTRYNAIGNPEVEMAQAGVLWLLGIPILSILALMWAFGWLH